MLLVLFIVEALQDIASTLGKKDWDFSVDPCSEKSNWTSPVQVKGSENAVTCNCSYVNGTVCHVTNMYISITLSLSFLALKTFSFLSLFYLSEFY